MAVRSVSLALHDKQTNEPTGGAEYAGEEVGKGVRANEATICQRDKVQDK